MKLFTTILFTFALCISPVVFAQTDNTEVDENFNFVVIDQPANTEVDTAQNTQEASETSEAQQSVPFGVVILGWVAAVGLIGLGSYRLIQKQKKR